MKEIRYTKFKCTGELRFRTPRKCFTTKANTFIHLFLPRVKNSEVGYVPFLFSCPERIYTLYPQWIQLNAISCIVPSLCHLSFPLSPVSCYYMIMSETVSFEENASYCRQKAHFLLFIKNHFNSTVT